MKKKVFIICSVRGASDEYQAKLENYVNSLENDGYKVHLPHRDTNQKASGIVASIFNFQDRDKEWEIKRKQQQEEYEKRRAEAKKSEYQGSIGDRITRKVHVVRETPIEGPYGISYLYNMVDDDGNVYTWFSSRGDMEVDRDYNLTGRVKTHETYRDTKQTVLTRCKVGEIEGKTLKEESFEERTERLGQEQRGEPESAMNKIQHSQIAQLYGHVAEHVGDLTHRMSELDLLEPSCPGNGESE